MRRAALEGYATATDLAAPLATVAERFTGLRAVVLASDGDWNAGGPPLDAAQGLRQNFDKPLVELLERTNGNRDQQVCLVAKINVDECA